MSADVRPARPGVVPALLVMMAESYAEICRTLDRSEARASFETILDDPGAGVRAIRVEAGSHDEIAQAVYRCNWFANADHVVMTATLAEAPPGEPSGV